MALEPVLRSLLSLVALVACVAGVAHANPHAAPSGQLSATREPTDPTAIENMQHGNRAIDAGAYDIAIDELQHGAIRDPVPLFWLDLGLAYRKANRYPEAIDAYREFLRRSAHDADPDGIRDQVIKLLPQLEAARNAPPTHPEPSDHAQTEPTGAASSAPTPAPTSNAASASPATAAAPPPTTVGAQAGTSRWHDGPALGLGASGIVAAGVGLYLIANASSLDDQAAHETDFSRRDQLRQSASSRRTVGVVTSVAGGVLLVAAVARFALVGSPSKTSTSSLQLTPGPGDVGLGFALDF